MKKSNWNPSRYPNPPVKELKVEDDPDTDTLTLWNGTPASNGWNVA